MTNSRRPTKYRLWKARSSPATWSLPNPSAAIAAVIVWPGSSGSAGTDRRPPRRPAMTTTIVSPIARETPRISDATMPEMAAGNTTRKVVSIFGAETVGRLAQRERHRAQCVLGHRSDERDRQDADADAGGERA